MILQFFIILLLLYVLVGKKYHSTNEYKQYFGKIDLNKGFEFIYPILFTSNLGFTQKNDFGVVIRLIIFTLLRSMTWQPSVKTANFLKWPGSKEAMRYTVRT